MKSTYYIGDKKVRMDLNKLPQPAHMGEEASIYFYEDLALKIYRGFEKNFASKEFRSVNQKKSEYLEQIDTKRFLLPQNSIYTRNYSYIGYSTDIIRDIKEHDEIQEMPISRFMSNMYEIKEDLKKLNLFGVMVTDVGWHNFLYNGDFYFTDCGGYFKALEYGIENADSKNKDSIEFLIAQLICNYSRENQEDDFIRHSFYDFRGKYKDPNIFASDYIELIVEKNPSIEVVKDLRRHIGKI